MTESDKRLDEETLAEGCGHHCGISTSGGKVRHVGHCSCIECHDCTDADKRLSVVDAIVCMNNADGLDLETRENHNG